MHLQDIFYIMAIALMSLGVIFMLTMVILLFYIKKKITDLQKYITWKVDNIVSLVERPLKTVTNFGANLLGKPTQ